MRLTFFLLLSLSLFGQEQSNEKIKKTLQDRFSIVMAYSEPTTDDLEDLVELGFRYIKIDTDSSMLLADKGIVLTKSENQLFYAKALSLKGQIYISIGDEANAMKFMESARGIFEELGDKEEMGEVDLRVGNFKLDLGQSQEAVDYYLSSIKLYKESKADPKLLLDPLSGIGGVYYFLGYEERAEKYLSEAILIADTIDATEVEISLRGNKSMLLFGMAATYKNKANSDSIPERIKLCRDSSQLLYGLGMKEAERSLSLAKELGEPEMILNGLETLAYLKIKIKEYIEGAEIAKEALAIAEKLDAKVYIVRTSFHLGNAMHGLNNLGAAQRYLEKGFELAEKLNFVQEQNSFRKKLVEVYIENGEKGKAMNMLIAERIQRGKTNRKEIRNAIAEADKKYQTSEKEKQLLQQKNDILALESTNAKIQRQKKYMMGGGLMLGLLGFIGNRFNKIRKDRNDKKEFAEALIFAQEEERKRISRDLHDGVGQSLLLIKKQLEGSKEVTLENQKMISDTLEEVRSISRDLHPFQLDKFGLTATIKDTILKIEQSTELFITKEIDDIDKVLTAKSEIHLYRTIQEALSNIVKHAVATAAKVNIKNEANRISVRIQDNGKGFDLELAVVTSKSLGIRTMHERISAIGGELKFSEGENGGTDLMIVIPK